MRKELKLKLLPNNQVSLFIQSVNRKEEERYSAVSDFSKMSEEKKEYYRSGQAAYDRENRKKYTRKRIPLYKADGSISYRLIREAIPEKENKRICPLMASAASLDITTKSQRKPKSLAGWGDKNKSKEFTHRAGQKIREAGAMMDYASGYNPSLCRVITLTLAGDTPEAFDALARYSGYAVNRLFQPIRRMGLYDSHWFFVWEYQKRGALHLHIALSNPDKDKSRLCGDRIIAKWIEVLRDIQEKSGIDMFVRRDYKSYAKEEDYQNLNQEMRKSAGGYFSKYAGKAERSEENSYVRKFSKMYPPSRFWGSSQSLKNLCKEFSYEEILAVEEEIEERYKEIIEWILLHNPVKYSSYEWKKKLYEGTEMELVISEGICETFYVNKFQFKEMITALKTKW